MQFVLDCQPVDAFRQGKSRDSIPPPGLETPATSPVLPRCFGRLRQTGGWACFSVPCTSDGSGMLVHAS